MFSYPFNKYGFEVYIEIPVKNFFWKLQAFKGVDICPWDCCDVQETVFANFKFFCKHYPNYFIEQYCCEYNGVADMLKHQHIKDEDVSLFDGNLESLLRLHEIQEYVLYTRDINNAKYEYIAETWHKSFVIRWVDSDVMLEDEHCSELVFDHNCHIDVEYWFENGELMYTLTKVDHETKFNPMDITDAVGKLDVKYAKEILDFKNYICD